jgi:hypothetical protein
MDPDPGGPKTRVSGSGCGSVTQVRNKIMPIHKTGRRKAVWRIRNVYPRYRIQIFTHTGSRISEPKTATKERVEKKKVLSFLFIRIRNTDGRVYTVSAIMVGGEKFFEGKEKDQIIHLAFNVKKIFF